MSIFDLYNSPRQFANSAINNLSKTQAIAPKRTLQDAYNEAMAKTTPTWATALAGAMPAIGEIVASQTIKDPWQQESVAGSLERQKDRQQAYNQFLQQQENEKAKDFVAMAKEQLGMDRADEDRAYNRDVANLARQDAYEKAKQAQEQQKFENSIKEKLANAQIAKANADIASIKAQNSPEAIAKKKENEDLDRRAKIAAVKRAERENDPEYIAQKEQKEQYEKDLSEVNRLIEKKLVNASDGAFLMRHPEAYREIIQRYPFSPFRGKFEVPSEVIEKYESAKGNNDPLGVR